MDEEIEMILEMAEDAMKKSIDHLNSELAKIRAGKATPSMLDGVTVDYYGSQSPLNQMSNINTPDPRTIMIQPFDKSMLDEIGKAITNANLGLNPQNNGEFVIINVPVLTEERRKDLVKMARAAGEHAKVGIRSARKDANDEVSKQEKDGLSEDEAKKSTAEIQKLTDSYVAKIDSLIDAKEKDIMTV